VGDTVAVAEGSVDVLGDAPVDDVDDGDCVGDCDGEGRATDHVNPAVTLRELYPPTTM